VRVDILISFVDVKLSIFLFIFVLGQTCLADCVCLDLETAWERVVAYAPSLAAADAQIGALEAEKKQVGLLPNPLAVIEADNIGVSNRDDEAEPPETTFALAQLIEIGGKRSARTSLASALVGVAYWDFQIQRCDLRLQLIAAFIEVSVAQEKLKLAQEKEQVAEEILQAIHAKAVGGKVSPIQTSKAHVALMAAQISVREALSELTQAKASLSSLWGCSLPDFDCVLFELFECTPPPCYCSVVEQLFQTPDFAKAKQEIFSASQNVKLQKVNSIPDLTLTVGYRIFNDSNQRGWIVGVEMPLPFFNRNQGNVQRARMERIQAECLMDEVMQELEEEIAVAHEKMTAAFEESEMIRTGILTEAIYTFNLIETGYENGKLEYCDLLDAQKTLFEIQEKYIEILYDYHLSRAELERLTGEKI
jgi:outer membrane protein, heavy metal efflux system